MAKSKVKQRPATSWDNIPAIIDAQGAALLLGINVQTVRRMACNGTLPATKVGKRIWRFEKADLMNAVSKGGIV